MMKVMLFRRRKIMKKMFAIIVALMMLCSLVAFAGCSKDDDATTDNPVETPKLTHVNIGAYADTSLVTTFDTNGKWIDGGGAGLVNLLYDSVYYANGKGEFVSRIVDGEPVWSDDTHLTLKILDGIKFSDGTPLTGEDVLYALEIVQGNPLMNDHYLVVDLSQSSVEADGLTLNFTFTQPYAMWKRSLSAAIYSKAYIESHNNGDDIDWYDKSQLLGSGPYVISDFAQDSMIAFAQRDDWWGFDKGYTLPFETATVTKYADQTTMAIDLENGVIDVATDLSLQDYNTLSANDSDDITVSIIPGNAVQILALDSKEEKLADKNIRLALAYAIDTTALTETVAGSLGVPATSTLAPGELGYVGGLSYPYDPDKAKELLAAAGYTADKPLQITFNTFSFAPYTTTAEIIQGFWEAVGIKCDVEFMEMGAFIGGDGARTTDVQIYGLTGGNGFKDPSMHLSDWLVTSPNKVMKRDQSYTDLILGALATDVPEDRAKIYGELQQKFYDNVDCIPMYEQNIAYAYNGTRVESFDISATGYIDLLEVVLK
jgi:ABC-type transport system substrate-binding protein